MELSFATVRGHNSHLVWISPGGFTHIILTTSMCNVILQKVPCFYTLGAHWRDKERVELQDLFLQFGMKSKKGVHKSGTRILPILIMIRTNTQPILYILYSVSKIQSYSDSVFQFLKISHSCFYPKTFRQSLKDFEGIVCNPKRPNAMILITMFV